MKWTFINTGTLILGNNKQFFDLENILIICLSSAYLILIVLRLFPMPGALMIDLLVQGLICSGIFYWSSFSSKVKIVLPLFFIFSSDLLYKYFYLEKYDIIGFGIQNLFLLIDYFVYSVFNFAWSQDLKVKRFKLWLPSLVIFISYIYLFGEFSSKQNNEASNSKIESHQKNYYVNGLQIEHNIVAVYKEELKAPQDYLSPKHDTLKIVDAWIERRVSYFDYGLWHDETTEGYFFWLSFKNWGKRLTL